MSYSHIFIYALETCLTFNCFVIFKNKSNLTLCVLANRTIQGVEHIECYSLTSHLVSFQFYLTPLSCTVIIHRKTTLTSEPLQCSKSAIPLGLFDFKCIELN
jgi:hypothetical protein